MHSSNECASGRYDTYLAGLYCIIMMCYIIILYHTLSLGPHAQCVSVRVCVFVCEGVRMCVIVCVRAHVWATVCVCARVAARRGRRTRPRGSSRTSPCGWVGM